MSNEYKSLNRPFFNITVGLKKTLIGIALFVSLLQNIDRQKTDYESGYKEAGLVNLTSINILKTFVEVKDTVKTSPTDSGVKDEESSGDNSIPAIITALGGFTGLAAILKARNERKNPKAQDGNKDKINSGLMAPPGLSLSKLKKQEERIDRLEKTVSDISEEQEKRIDRLENFISQIFNNKNRLDHLEDNIFKIFGRRNNQGSLPSSKSEEKTIDVNAEEEDDR